jgi:hypothetical protein
MKLSAGSHRQLEEFFREYFGDEKLKLPEIQIYGRRGARLLTRLLSVDGITFGRHIFITPRHLRRGEDKRLYAPRELIAHEITHTLQYLRHGTFKFFYLYLKGFFEALRQKENWNFRARMEAYLEIPHEVEARLLAAKYVNWCERRKIYFSSSINTK